MTVWDQTAEHPGKLLLLLQRALPPPQSHQVTYVSSKDYPPYKEGVGQGHKAQKATEAAMKQAATTRAEKPLPEAVDGLPEIRVTVSMTFTVIDCANGVVSLGSLVLVPVNDAKENIVAVSQVPVNLPPPPI